MTINTDQQFIDTFSLAEKLCAENKLDESLVKYQSLLEIQPSHISVLNNIGLVYEKKGDFNKASDFYRQCHTQQPDQVIILHNLANAYTQLGRWADANPLLAKLVQTDFQNEINAEKYALCLFNIGSKEDTRDFINDTLDKYPHNPVLNRLLGRTLLRLNEHIDGLHYLQKSAGMIEFNADGVRYLN